MKDMGVPDYVTMRLPDAHILVFKDDTGYTLKISHRGDTAATELHCASVKELSDTIAVHFVTHRLES